MPLQLWSERWSRHLDGIGLETAITPVTVQGSAACERAEVVVLAASPRYHAWDGNFERMLDTVLGAVAAVGARTNSFLHRMFLEPALAGKAMQILLADDQPYTFHYLPDVARGCATLVEHPEADGRAWVIDATRFETTFGRIEITDHDTALRQTLAWQQPITASERA